MGITDLLPGSLFTDVSKGLVLEGNVWLKGTWNRGDVEPSQKYAK